MKISKLCSSSTLLGLAIVSILSGCDDNPLADKLDKDMILVDGGSYTMGSDSDDASVAEKPAHPVTLHDFYISKYEVTQELYAEVMGGSKSYFQNPKNPVNNLSWQQANTFITKLNSLTGENFRLPTEAEWEFAAKGGIKSKGFTYAGSNNIDDVAWYSKNSNNKAHFVGQKKPNELGLYDMTGNVGEFVIDAYDVNFFTTSPVDDPKNIDNSTAIAALKTVRGASFAYDTNESENYRRDFVSQTIIMADVGLRLVKDAD